MRVPARQIDVSILGLATLALPLTCIALPGEYALSQTDPLNAAGRLQGKEVGHVLFEVGDSKTIIPPNKELRYFPDEPVCVITRSPLTFTLVNGQSTLLMGGDSFEKAVSLGKVLEPGKAGEFDNGYAGISGVFRDDRNGQLIAVYHAEDHEGMPVIPGNGVPGFYSSMGLAVSNDNGRTFKKMGRIVTSSLPKIPDANLLAGGSAQGIGDASLCLSADGEYLFMYYDDLSRVDNRGCQTCMARCKASDGGRSGTWWKFHEGKFDQPGLGGKDTPVVQMKNKFEDAISPNVTYVPALKKYVMFFCANAYADVESKKAKSSGICGSTSDDGVKWADPVLLFKGLTVPVPGGEFASRPGLVLDDPKEKSVTGWLYYAFSPRWGFTEQNPPHYMAGRSVRLSLEAGG